MKQSKLLSKYLLVLFIPLSIIIILTGCSKLLDTNRQGGYDESNYPYPGGSGPYDQFIFGAYNDLRSYSVHVDGFVAATSIRSDDADKGSTPADGGADLISMDNFPVLPSSGRANALWTGYFGLINKCNNTLYQIGTNAAITATEAVKLQTQAEARFMRGYSYFMLVRLFGRVPLIDTFYVDPAAQNNIPQSTPAQIYSFVENDLNFAAMYLPLKWDAKFVGRATKGMANGILAKVYLTQQKWALAMSTANAVITSGQYDLSTPYAKIFSEDGENSSESIFEIQATADANNPTSQGIQYTSIQGVRGAGAWDLGWGWNSPSTYLEAAYEAGDPRRARTILYAGGTTIHGEAVPTSVPNPRYNHKVHTNPAFRSSVGSRFGWWMNVRILRYADVVLMYAEAANEMGNTTEALEKLELVRARARAGNNTILPPVSTRDQAQLRNAIRQERRVELAMEHERFFDLVRWGIAGTTLPAAGKTNYVDSRDRLLPIPQTQIDLSKGVLTQNPGY
ncbi:RagB/SusD family nutrient uptake outer membrane protein [Segetibacter sp. 3557_3]|uniref:RagB/SusD family nutrient uptake outer membrane protein n=1 Tax=Segetibacter sp. 3557_3 TaxID=2547429 RepID=UPI0010584EDB|nr:RagB/SusD family nutrient uptake outer membrane protein [Segetibacter sp. 3557_3]TDH23064.1 RagB/SusD family nutrient uptake outer membrane protein [Segetibacter sp. 3557_3]